MRRLFKTVSITLFLGLVILFSSFIFHPLSYVYAAAAPPLINYQGWLTDNEGKPLDGARDITFKIYNAATAGTLLWQETHTGVAVENGVFFSMLGSVEPINLSFDKDYFLEIVVDDELMHARQRITSVGYAIRAETADGAVFAETAKKAQSADKITNPIYLVPKGGIILCKTSCPAGYRRISELDGKFLVAGASYNPEAGGTNQRTLTENDLPLHTHSFSHGHNIIMLEKGGPRRGGILLSDYASSTEADNLVSSYSGYSATTGTGDSFDVRPAFATVVICEKE